MIQIYCRKADASSSKALHWLEDHGIPTEKKEIEQLSPPILFQILLLSEEGIEGVLKYKNRLKKEKRERLEAFYNLPLNEGLLYLSKNTELLRAPIILTPEKVLIGFNSEEIRQFLPRDYRTQARYS